MKFVKKLMFRLAERRLRRIPSIQRGQARFRLHYPEKYEFGVGSYGLPKVHDWNEGATLKIGNFCSIAAGVQVFLGGNHRHDWITTFPLPAFLESGPAVTDYGVSKGDVIIGSDVWLGANSAILSGVTIGHGAVVGAYAVVTRDVEPFSIVAGNPAKHVKWRFDEATREHLLNIGWWNWAMEEVEGQVLRLCSSNVDGLIDYANQRNSSFK